jgi:hypothetical protein
MANHTVRASCSTVVLLASVLAIAACNNQSDSPRISLPASQIAMAYHGELLDDQLRPISNVSEADANAFYQQNGWTGSPLARAPGSGTLSSYMTECQNKGVPLPPPWGDSAWQKVGELPPDKIFAATALPTVEVWVFKTPLGICYALPRKDASGVIRALGIICQGQESSVACFWDNIRTDGSKIVGDSTKGMKANDMQGGDVLKENCTDCHRGENVFIIHPSTPLQQNADSAGANKDPSDPNGKPTQPVKKPYTPLGQSTWLNDSSDLTFEADGCAFCHELPKLTKGYCQILKQTVGKTMPPPDGKKTDPSFEKDIKKLKEACNKLDSSLGW